MRRRKQHQDEAVEVNAEANARTKRIGDYQPPTYKYAILASLLAALCYSNSLQGEFLFDDVRAIEKNKDVIEDTPVASIFQHVQN